MRVVLDTNIVVRFVYSPCDFIVGLLFVCSSRRGTRWSLRQNFFARLLNVLARPRLRVRHQMNDDSSSQFAG